MRNGQHCPNSGGSTIWGNSGDKVCVRSTTRTRPEMRSAARAIRELSAIACSSSIAQLALECLRTLFPAGEPLLRHIARIHILDAVLERLDDGLCQRLGAELRR